MRVNHKENIVEVKNVSFSYGENEILKNINFNIHRGDYLGIVGSNGSGKTTLLKIILGLLKPSSGSIKLFGVEDNDFKSRSKIGYVPQKVTNFDANFPATVMEVVLMGRYAKRGLFRKLISRDRLAARHALERVEMGKYEDRLIGELSGGEQQRVFIARALAAEPEIIFLDEPTTGVDKAARDDFYVLLKKLNQDLDLTVVLITHDIEDIAYEAMHVACLDRTLFFYGTLEDFLKEKLHSAKDGRVANHHHNA
ncbi:MAG: metal ABC transporter ATP-binding protein [Patescibacteria group bacterium]